MRRFVRGLTLEGMVRERERENERRRVTRRSACRPPQKKLLSLERAPLEQPLEHPLGTHWAPTEPACNTIK
ncbi:hypothetical protein I7I48_10164 [Histoplasma ohiense]|nr:hypothetical protein I7I48_10164 [Histoplasma ohiense (nom. inval.)]